MSPSIRIIVATHKEFRMPEDPMYMPVHAGHAGKQDIGFQGDDTGDNISRENARFCELTTIYWAWKNLDADYIGLVHYRRHFTARDRIHRIGKDKFDCILGGDELSGILKQYDLVLPKQRRYYIESLWSHHMHLPHGHESDLKILREVIQSVQPDYLECFDTVMKRTHAHMFNMFVMKKEIFDRYCEWLFSILTETDKRIDVADYNPMETRAVSYFGEFMIDIWNEKQKIPYKELPVMFMEKQNWFVKGGRFLIRKFKGK